MEAAIVIFARLDSSRLPGKALRLLADRPVLAWTIERCRRADPSLPVIVSTTERPADDPIAELAGALGVPVFRGATQDVLGRALACAGMFALETLVRVSGDSPFIAPEVISQVVDRHRSERPDITTNVFPRTFPPGISAEALARATLDRLAKTTDDPEEREHVTRYIYENPGEFTIVNVEASGPGYNGLHLAIDTPEDFARARWVAERLSSPDAALDEIIALAASYEDETAERRGDER